MTTLLFRPHHAIELLGPPSVESAVIEAAFEGRIRAQELVYAPRASRASVLKGATRMAREADDPIAFRVARTRAERDEDGWVFPIDSVDALAQPTFEAYRLLWTGFSRDHWRVCCRHERTTLEPSLDESDLEKGALVFHVTPGVYELRYTHRNRYHLLDRNSAFVRVDADGALSRLNPPQHDVERALAAEAGVDWEAEKAEIERQIKDATVAAREAETRLTPFGDRSPDNRWQAMERRWFALDYPNWHWFAERIRDLEFWRMSNQTDVKRNIVDWVRQNAGEQTITQLARAHVDDLVDAGEPMYITPYMVEPWQHYKDAALYVVQASEWALVRGVEIVCPYPAFPDQLYEIADREIAGALSVTAPVVAPWVGVAPRPRAQ